MITLQFMCVYIMCNLITVHSFAILRPNWKRKALSFGRDMLLGKLYPSAVAATIMLLLRVDVVAEEEVEVEVVAEVEEEAAKGLPLQPS